MKKIYLCAALAFFTGAFAFENHANQIPPDCTLIPATAATSTSGDAGLAIDSNGATRWESMFNDAESLTVDLGATVNVNTVTIDWETANAKDYILKGSVDGTTWVDIETLTDMPAGARTDVLDGINASYRYLKMEGVLRNTAYGYSIWEFYVCADAIVVPDCTQAVVASATASTGDASLAIDDNLATRWESTFEDPQTLTVDLGVVDFVKQVSITWETANAKDYTLSGSVDGTTWTVIQTLTDMATGPRVDEFDIDAEYRYFQMYGTARNTAYGYSIFEFDVCVGEDDGGGTEPFVCDSPLTPVSAIGTTGNGTAAIDDNDGTRWESDASDPQSLTVDMGETVTVNAVTIDWETANAKDYILSGSVDGTNWTVIESFTNMATGERTDEILDIDADYRYLKMDGIARNTPYGYSIWEFNVCGEDIEVPPTPFVCDSPVTVASATATTGNATAAIDDNDGTRWESDATDLQSLTVDMGEVIAVTAVTIEWETANAKDYTLSGSVDGTAWTTIQTLTDMPTGERTDVINDIDADYRYLKVDGTARNTPYGYSIWEFNVCGEDNEVPPTPFVCDSPLEADSATATTGTAVAAIDGNEGTRWESEASDPQSLMVDMGEVVTVEAVTIDWETANAKDYTLSGSVEGTEWAIIQTLTDMPTGERTDDITDINTDYRYLKVDGSARNTPYGYSIWEFKVCGQAPEEEIEYVEVPAVLEAENWYDMSGVDTEATGDTGGGLSVGWIDTGDWMDYAIDVEETGTYSIDARVASTADTGIVEYFINGTSLGTLNVPNTGGWQVWQTVSKTVTLNEGEQMLRVGAAAAPFNLNWIEIKTEATQGLTDFESAGITMYPNPAEGQVTITIAEDAHVSLYSYTGALVKQYDIKAGNNTIGLNGLATGLYFVKVNNHVSKLMIK